MASVFICYAHKDNLPPRTRWLNELRVNLAPYVRANEMTVFSDEDIQPGQKWHEEIAAQLQSARAAVLLISPDFLASEYIANSELPVLLKRAHDGGLTILPLHVRPSAYENTRFKWPDPRTGPNELTLSSIQAVGSSSQTLSELPRSKWERVLVDLGKRIGKIVDSQQPARQTPSATAALRVSIGHLPSAGAYLLGRETELARLHAAWETPHEHIITVVGRGGEGKSNLVRHWLNDMAATGWRNAGRVYGWSFYSQGTNDKAASADQFIDAALRFFGEPEPERLKSADARGERLAELVGAQRNLLILDGLEPLQYPPGPMHGRLKDPALQTLITGLAAKNHGLCVITTREPLPELAASADKLSPQLSLPPLDAPAGARLLAKLGIAGTDAERETVADQLSGHAFSIHLLGTYLAEVYNGDITRAGEIALLEGNPDSRRHALHLLSSYEKWLSGRTLTKTDLPPDEAAEAEKTGAQMLAVLRLLGLFDRPAAIDAINALREEPAIRGLTEPLVSLTFAEWQRTLARLRNLQLIDHDLGGVETIDAHPLLREYFAEQLEKIPDSTTEAHRRLYEHFKNAAPDLPDTLRDMAPLFQAVVHGCRAGEWQEALDEVFFRRIQREGDYFASKNLGAVGACLTALAAFFAHPWREVAGSFSADDIGFVLNNTGVYLAAVGRFKESTEPFLLALNIAISAQRWKQAGVAAHNLSDTYLTLGEIATAVTYAERASEFAARSGDSGIIAHCTTSLGDALYAAQALDAAQRAFTAAEMMMDRTQPFLLGVAGYQHAELLLRIAASTAEKRQRAYDIALRTKELLAQTETERLGLESRAFLRALIGRMHAILGEDQIRARQLLDEAVSLLREASRANRLAMGLVERAAFARVTGTNREAADRDLTEAEQLSIRFGMVLWQIESTVERAWFHHIFGAPQVAREKVAEAKQLIKKTEKPYVPHVWTYEQPPLPFIGVFKPGQTIGYYRCNDSIAELERLLGA